MKEVLYWLRPFDQYYGHLPYALAPKRVGDQTPSWRSAIPIVIPDDVVELDITDSERARQNNEAKWDNYWYRLFCFDPDGYREWDRHYTNIVAITGPGTPFEEDSQTRWSDLAPDTILLTEVTPEFGVEWMRSGDLDVRTMPRSINHPSGKGIGGNYAGGFMVGFADGEVWFLNNNTPFHELEKFFAIERAKKNDRQESLGPFLIERHEARQ